MRVPVERPAHRPRRPRPLGEAGEAVGDRVAHEAVHRHPGLGPHAVRRDEVDPAPVEARDQAADAAVADEDVRAPSQPGERHAGLARETHGDQRLFGRAHLGQEIGRSPHPERRERGEGRLPAHAVLAERRAKGLGEVHRGMLPHSSPGAGRRDASYRSPSEISARAWTSNGRPGMAETEPKPRVAYSVPVRFRRLSRNRTRRSS